jgi:hypothetical protein
LTELNYHRVNLPADIAVFAGSFASQPLAFAHLLDLCPTLNLDHIEVIPAFGCQTRLAAHFDPEVISDIRFHLGTAETCILVLPAAFKELECPLRATELLRPLGDFRGTIARMIPDLEVQ